MNPYYYLFYKLTCFLNKKKNNEWGPIGAITFFVGLNIVVIYVNLLHITEENSKGIYKNILIIIAIALFIINSILFLNKRRQKKIMNRYNNESIKNKKLGSFLVILYLVITLLSILFA